jgi:hypothetical protein
MAPEFIDLEADDAPPPPVLTTMDGAGIMGRRGRRRHLRFRVEMDRHDDDDNDDDDDIVEITVPALMAVSSSSSSSFPSAEKRRAPPSWVGRIRDVFPLVIRSKVELLLAKAASYLATDDPNDNEEGAFHAVMTVLAECDLTGASIPEASLASAVVGGRPCGGRSLAAVAGRQREPDGCGRESGASA